MARKPAKPRKREIENYAHAGKERVNNPPVGLVTPETDEDAGKKAYRHDPHIDPQLSWAGKAEHTSFEVPTVSLHVHERVDPRTIIEAVRKRNGRAASTGARCLSASWFLVTMPQGYYLQPFLRYLDIPSDAPNPPHHESGTSSTRCP